MTYDLLEKLLIERWNESGRISTGGRAIVLSADMLKMILACIEIARRNEEVILPSGIREP